MRLILTAAGAAGLTALVLGTPLGARPHALPAGNVVQNAGAEAGPAATSSGQTVPPTGWTTTAGFSAVAYNDKLGFPGSADSAAIGGGASFFAGGPNTEVGTATQSIDVAAAAAELDAGGVTAKLSAFLGGYAAHPDAARVDLEYLDATAGVLGSLRIGPVTNADRGNTTKLLARSASGPVPVGTRQLRVRITATRSIGPYNDGYADNVAVELSAKAPPSQAKPVLTARCARHKITLGVKPAAGQTIASVTFLAAGKVVGTDKKAPFSITFASKKKRGAVKVAARVLIDRKTTVLSKSVGSC